MSRAAAVGAGSWGTALANLLEANGHVVRLWAREPALAQAMAREGRNPRCLPEFPLAGGVEPTSDLAAAVAGAEIVVSAVPSQAVREVMVQLGARSYAVRIGARMGAEWTEGARGHRGPPPARATRSLRRSCPPA